EPLSNLDAKLRVQMRSEISKLHKKLQTTFIYVTHDQTEAMTMGSKIVVMKDGVIQQVASPVDIYNEPCNVFVAGFIGSPQMNFINATLVKEDAGVYLVNDGMKIKLPEGKASRPELNDYFGKEVIVGIRPENIYDDEAHIAALADCKISAEVTHTEMMGAETYLFLDACATQVGMNLL
ncbi:MAG: ABC transporter ATP-binding protein, partial [Clostridia bacterium]|nr:ABC transporter ATP-binding protein [Clostridia bacterium]